MVERDTQITGCSIGPHLDTPRNKLSHWIVVKVVVGWQTQGERFDGLARSGEFVLTYQVHRTENSRGLGPDILPCDLEQTSPPSAPPASRSSSVK